MQKLAHLELWHFCLLPPLFPLAPAESRVLHLNLLDSIIVHRVEEEPHDRSRGR